MFEQQDLPSGSEHAPGLGDRAPWIRDRAEAKRADDGVETVVRELERFGIPEAEIGRVRELSSPWDCESHRGSGSRDPMA